MIVNTAIGPIAMSAMPAADPDTDASQPSAWARKITTGALAGKPLPANLTFPVDPESAEARFVQAELATSRLGHAHRVRQAGGYSPTEERIG